MAQPSYIGESASVATPRAALTPLSAAVSKLVERTTLALLSAGLLVLAFPEPGFGILGWVALAPLMLAVRDAGLGSAAALGWLSGAAAAVGIYRWIFEIGGFGWPQAALLGVYLGMYSAVWCAGLVGLSRSRVPLIVSAPALWVLLEFVRGHAGFLALPWATLAHSQHENLALLQLASVAGEAGVGFVVAMGSVVALAALRGRAGWATLLAGLGAIASFHGIGMFSLASPVGEPVVRVAVVQPAYLRQDSWTAEQLQARYERLERLTRDVAPSTPALIVWPETAVRGLGGDPSLLARLRALAAEVGASLLVGSSEAEKFSPQGRSVKIETHNAAYHLPPGGQAEPPYAKMRLVPFGEYIPLQAWISWPEWLVPQAFDVTPGASRRTFQLEDGTPFAPLICWENVFADFVRPAVADGARLLVHMTNDNWFGRSAQPRQHQLASVLRAVENRVPIVVASNGGPSQMIDSRGRVRAVLPDLFRPGTLSAELPLGSGPTFYTGFGDWFVLVAAGLLVSACVLRPKEGRSSVPPA